MRKRKYYSYAKAKQVIARLQFKTLAEYRKFVIDTNVNTLPKEPHSTYFNEGYKTHDFLGLPEDVYKANLKAERQQMTAHMRTFITEESHAKRRKPHAKIILPAPVILPAPIIQNIIGLEPDKVISFLISEDVAPETIVKLVAEMDIKSSALMNDLCKYMQERSKRQQATWRPTGYNTAEAQMSIKNWQEGRNPLQL